MNNKVEKTKGDYAVEFFECIFSVNTAVIIFFIYMIIFSINEEIFYNKIIILIIILIFLIVFKVLDIKSKESKFRQSQDRFIYKVIDELDSKEKVDLIKMIINE